MFVCVCAWACECVGVGAGVWGCGCGCGCGRGCGRGLGVGVGVCARVCDEFTFALYVMHMSPYIHANTLRAVCITTKAYQGYTHD